MPEIGSQTMSPGSSRWRIHRAFPAETGVLRGAFRPTFDPPSLV